MILAELQVGQNVRLVDYGNTPVGYRRRLLSLGLTCGAEVKIVRRAPLGCPVQISVRNTALTLREDEAGLLVWELI